MMQAADDTPDEGPCALRTVLLIDSEVVVRAPLADYLRDCGLMVLEASTTDEGRTILVEGRARVDVVLCDAAAVGTAAGFLFSRWMRARYPAVPVLLAGSVEKAASLAGDICDEGPSLGKPYDLSVVLDVIRQAYAARPARMDDEQA